MIVAAAILDGAPPRVLAARRAAPRTLAGWWEFPGGKVEPGEDDLDALHRECREELGIDIEVGPPLGEVPIDIEGSPALLRAWLARIRSGTVVAHDHDAVRWLDAATLDDVAWLPADEALVRAVRRHLSRAVGFGHEP